jgi:hypothetical protein
LGLFPAMRRRWADLTLTQLWAIVVLGCIAAFVSLGTVQANDFWWHVRAGQWILEHRQVPTVDLFSYTRIGQPWAYQSWLMEVAYYLLLQAGGLPLVILFQALLITAAYALLLRLAWEACGELRLAAWATLAAAAVSFGNWTVRPQTISFPLFVLVLYAITRPQPRSLRRQWWLVPVFCLWANAHGGFIFGLGLLGTSFLAEAWAWVRRRAPFPAEALALAALCVAATLATPLGVRMIPYVLGFLRHPITQTINIEFMPPSVRTLDGKLFFAYAILWVSVALASGYRPRLCEALRLLAFAALALLAVRSEPWFGIVAAPSLAAGLGQWSGAHGQGVPRRNLPIANQSLALLVGLLVLCTLPWFRPYLPLPERRGWLSPETPVAAVAALRRLPAATVGQPRRVFHSEGAGAYLIWAAPEIPVFIDTRFELYPEAQWLDYIALAQGRYNWQALLDRYQVDTLFLLREGHKSLLAAASASPLWQQVYEDAQTVILQRRSP